MRQLVLLLVVLGLASAQYSPALAKKACYVAKLAASPNCMQCQLALKDITNFQIPKQKLQGVAAYNQEANSIFVAFRGTKEHQNWKINLKVMTRKYEHCGNCLIHTGFAEAASLLYPEVNKAVNKLIKLYGLVPIVMTGHSLGGVLAALVGLQLMQQLKLNTSFTLYTFGAPRAGNKEFGEYASKMFKESYRVVYKRDSIPHLPPKLRGYTHFGTEIWYELNNSYKTCTGDNKEKCSNSVRLMLLRKSDHRLENYLRLYEEQDSGLRSSPVAIDEQEAEGLQGYEMLTLITQNAKRSDIQEFAN